MLLGAPGSGKGTQAEKIVAQYNLDYLSTGDLLRTAVAEGNALGKLAKGYIDKGQLVPDDVILGIIRDYIDEHTGVGILFDGFPRTIAQAEGLDDLLKGDTVLTVSLEVDDEQVIKRLSARRSCRICGKTYNMVLGINPAPNGRCSCGGEIYQRDDDQIETIANRLRIYHDQIEPVKDFYRRKGLLVEIEGTGSPDDVFDRIREVLD